MKTSLILPDPADAPAGLIPVVITVWVKHPELGEVVRDVAESLAAYLNVYAAPLDDAPPDLIDTLDARSGLYPGSERQ